MSTLDDTCLADIVPQSARCSPITMGLLWITMVTSFPGVLVGFTWFKQGLSLTQVIVCTIIGCLLMLLYALPAAHIGSVSGQSYCSLVKGVFGTGGNKIVTFNLIWMFIAWYGLCSLFMAEGLEGLFRLPVPILVLAPIFAVVMAFNNFWGFKGVANFARFFAAPLLIVWVLYTFSKTISTIQPTVLTETGSASFPAALTLVTNFVIGFCVWGNEADYWRYGKAKLSNSAVPISTALMLGMFIFPVTGWLVARMTGITETAAATAFMNNYSFGGIAILGAIVLAASYFAANDCNLFGSSSALAQLVTMPHKSAVTILTICGAIVAAILSGCGCAQSLEKVASLNCVIMAMPTVILVAEYFLVRKLFGIKTDFSHVAKDSDLPGFRIPAVVALAVGCSVGIFTAGVIPGLESLHVGICSFQGWVAGLAVYIPLRWLEHRQDVLDNVILGEASRAMQPQLAMQVEPISGD
ncbi:MAG: cytosine permease [Candidatus Obscuribacterales bacterium]|nr:cytosine permease [Candidatus Obscuribacterales bacterium]